LRINISIDDVSPHPLSSLKVLEKCARLLDACPGLKFSLFVPMAYWRTIPGTPDTCTEKPLFLNEHPIFCDTLRRLRRDTFELGYHGFFHGVPGRSNNDELQGLDLDAAHQVIESMITMANRSGLFDVFKPILRPPAWRMSHTCFQAAYEKGVRLFTLSPDDYALATYGGANEYYPSIYYDVNPPIKSLREQVELSVVYHACEWDINYLSDERVDELIAFLSKSTWEGSFIEELNQA